MESVPSEKTSLRVGLLGEVACFLRDVSKRSIYLPRGGPLHVLGELVDGHAGVWACLHTCSDNKGRIVCVLTLVYCSYVFMLFCLDNEGRNGHIASAALNVLSVHHL